ncbi:DSBA oxidoreductase [Magnetococcus marinus MC-1]|uniref:DSBA oxidoreductase n=1 Tax=Magnetococcus marinus (strain ATCC BAA-1437 / JCM 17883 / MC-1) TaxID=156889 RepID=A0L4S6_MAGMM|nr:thioredoxin domain-containing protein [Magnetococcus marinus]ABK42969.1 DSBA oxidoreductase [Magnetococcus marinus MC-1]
MITYLKQAALALAVMVPMLSSAYAESPVVGQMGTWKVTLEELDKSIAGELFELENKIYETRAKALDSMMVEHLLDTEAKKQGITIDALEKREVTDKVTPVSDAEVAQFIEQNSERLPNAGEGLEERIKSYLTEQRAAKFRRALLAQLMSQVEVTTNLPEPEEPRYTFNSTMTPSLGAADAPVTIVEFSDFECPYCRRVQPALKQLKTKYGDKIQFVFRHYPLSFHKLAPLASKAAMCGEDQQQFWAFHDALFEEGVDLSRAGLDKVAADLKLDMALFKNCLDSNKHEAKLDADLTEGQSLGVTGTPTFFINGRKSSGALPYSTLEKMVEQELTSK